MSKYRINPTGVGKVLKATNAEAKKFKGIFEPLNGYVASAATAGYDMGPLGAALETFFTEQGKGLALIGSRVSNGIAGAALATRAYIHSDEKMVQTIQSKAAALTLADELQSKKHSGHSDHKNGPR